jgi:hypothetical protein
MLKVCCLLPCQTNPPALPLCCRPDKPTHLLLCQRRRPDKPTHACLLVSQILYFILFCLVYLLYKFSSSLCNLNSSNPIYLHSKLFSWYQSKSANALLILVFSFSDCSTARVGMLTRAVPCESSTELLSHHTDL